MGRGFEAPAAPSPSEMTISSKRRVREVLDLRQFIMGGSPRG